MPRKKFRTKIILPETNPTSTNTSITILPHSNENTNIISKKVGKTDFLINTYIYSGGREEVLTYLDYFGVPEVFLDLAIAQIEYLAARNNTYMEVV